MPSRLLLYIGNYTIDDDAAVYYAEVDPASGGLTILGKTPCEDAPSYLALHPSGRYLYAANEVTSFDGGGAVSAFSIDPDSGALTFLNLQPTVGSPCHNTVDATGRYLLCANYGGSSICMFPILDDGSVGEMADFRRHEGSSVNKARQDSPHPHSFNIDPANRFAFCADLGLDKILVYELDLEAGKLKEHGAASVTPGGGPRHFAFHPNRRFGYIINEMGNTVTAFTYDEGAGALSEIQEIPTIPEDFSEHSDTADIAVTPDGRFLYGSNRGHDSVAMFAIGADGCLSPLGNQAVPATPRSVAIDPSGTFFYSGGQNTNIIPVFRIDETSGRLQATGHEAETPSPVCLKFLEVS